MKKIIEICQNVEKQIFENAYYQEDVKEIDKDNLKKLIKQLPDLYKYVESNKKEEINSLINEYIEKTCEIIHYKKNRLQNWEMIKTQLIQQSIIQMTNKCKSELGSTNLNTVIIILCKHMESFPNFFNKCKTEEKKNEIRAEIKYNAKPIAQEYIYRKEEERRRREEEEKRRIEEEKKIKREVEERKRIEAFNMKLIEEQNRRWKEVEEYRRKEEQERRRLEYEIGQLRIENERIRREEEERRRRDEEERRRREEEEERRRRDDDDSISSGDGSYDDDGFEFLDDFEDDGLYD